MKTGKVLSFNVHFANSFWRKIMSLQDSGFQKSLDEFYKRQRLSNFTTAELEAEVKKREEENEAYLRDMDDQLERAEHAMTHGQFSFNKK